MLCLLGFHLLPEGFRAALAAARRATHQKSTAKRELRSEDSRIKAHRQISAAVRLSGQRGAGVGPGLQAKKGCYIIGLLRSGFWTKQKSKILSHSRDAHSWFQI